MSYLFAVVPYALRIVFLSEPLYHLSRTTGITLVFVLAVLVGTVISVILPNAVE